MPPNQQARFRILKILAEDPDLSQRELAKRLGVSLGKSHYLLKALIEKGLINSALSPQHSALSTGMTPAGIRERVRLTGAYLARKEAEYDALKAEIEELKSETIRARNGRKAA